ncbi:predicted protein [Naegleria gruberi]|uniref:RNA-dependent RNA polymerase n=1 Tax=Naegleria gruberi TaxID=5762 RepID=D2VYX5_NAEGR|nr:uncharacterized protein NAEGRDRAFT_81763 [Naegleria gruberi]EFC38028.1 predicted protein [Naegleria gruberi]|eukprot:XP_002670772.1 predicted protein [Naegleria gruberi strain NEG-M]
MSVLSFVSGFSKLEKIQQLEELKFMNRQDENYVKDLLATYYMIESIPIIRNFDDCTKYLEFNFKNVRGEKYCGMSFVDRYEILKRVSRMAVIAYPIGLEALHRWLLATITEKEEDHQNLNLSSPSKQTTEELDESETMFRTRTATLYCFYKPKISPILAIRFNSSQQDRWLQSRFRQKFGVNTVLNVGFSFLRMGFKSQMILESTGEHPEILNNIELKDQVAMESKSEDHGDIVLLRQYLNQFKEGKFDEETLKLMKDQKHISRVLMDNQSFRLIEPYIEREEPLHIAGFTFQKLCQNTSGMHSYRFIYMCPDLSKLPNNSSLSIHDVKTWAIPDTLNRDLYFENNKLKQSLRLALFNTPVIPTIGVSEYTVINDEGLFTDGCGFISLELAMKVYEIVRKSKNLLKYQSKQSMDEDGIYEENDGVEFLVNEYLPCAYQIRFRGAKGMVYIHPNAEKVYGHHLVLRKSMMKIEHPNTDDDIINNLCIVGYSSPCDFARINSTIMHILEGCEDETKQGKIFEILNQKACKHIENLMKNYISESDIDKVFDQYVKQGDYASLNVLSILKSKKLAFLTGPYRNQILSLRIPCYSSRRLYGIADPFGVLKEGQIFIQVSSLNDPKKKNVIENTVIVTKEPCLHRGDLRKLEAVNIPELNFLYDVIVFPTKGSRPITNMIAGSDLDGDQYFACWDNELVESLVEFDPGSFDDDYNETRSFDPDIFKDLIGIRHLFADFYGNQWSRKYWNNMERLCTLINRAIDAPKKGNYSVAVNAQDLELLEKFPGFPHYHKNKHGPLRRSVSLVGKLYDSMQLLVSQKLEFKDPNSQIARVDDRQHLITFIKYKIANIFKNNTKPNDYQKRMEDIYKELFQTIFKQINKKKQRVQMVSEMMDLFWRFFVLFLKDKEVHIISLNSSLKSVTQFGLKMGHLIKDKSRFILIPNFSSHILEMEKSEQNNYTLYSLVLNNDSQKRKLISYFIEDAQRRNQYEMNVNTLEMEGVEYGVLYSASQLDMILEVSNDKGEKLFQQAIHYSKTNNTETFELFKKVYDSNYIPAINYVASMLEDGDNGISSNELLAFKLYQKALDLSKQKLSTITTDILVSGEHIILGNNMNLKRMEIDEEYRKLIFREAEIISTHIEALRNVARMFFNKGNYQEAHELYLEASTKFNDSDSQYDIGEMYELGDGVLLDKHEAIIWYLKAVESDVKNSEALFRLGYLYKELKDNQKAWDYYQKAAELGNNEAQYEVACIYHHTLNIIQTPNYSLAFEWYCKSANQGNSNAQYSLGMIYMYGLDKVVPKNIKLAHSWLLKAAQQQNSDAELALGKLLCETDVTQGTLWLLKAAKNGNQEARGYFGEQYNHFSAIEFEYEKQSLTRVPTFVSKPKRNRKN